MRGKVLRTGALSLAFLKALPTLSTGHMEDLKIDQEGRRVWLSRTTRADGARVNNEVTEEELTKEGWITRRSYQAK